MTTALDRLEPARRERLVQLAAAEFAARGLQAASLNRILAAAGMSKSSFYHVLGSKQDLFDLAVADLADAVAADLRIPAPEAFAGPGFWERIDALVGEVTATLVGNDRALLLGRMVYATIGDALTTAAPIARIYDWAGEVLAVGRRSGQIRTDLPADLQLDLLTAVLRALDEWSVQHMDEVPPQRFAHLANAESALLRRLLGT